jgi:16S rRNA (uracil1498-N3)-methyltransferase
MSQPKIRLFVNAALYAGATVTPTRDQANYLFAVMRLTVGDGVTVFNGQDGAWTAEVAEANRKHASLRVTVQTAPQETPPDLWLLAAPLKKGRIDWLAEKACELGVSRLHLVTTARTVVDRVNIDRLTAHMIEAAEQCERTAVPALLGPDPLARLLAAWPPDRALIFCDETGGPPITTALDQGPAAILIGPEGGFTPAEREAIRAVPQAKPVSLGPRILRADTAAVAAISVWQATIGDWKNTPSTQ